MTGGELLTVAQIATPVVVGGIGWLVRNSLARFTDQLDSLRQAQAKDAADLAEHVRVQESACDKHMASNAAAYSEIAETKVDREDWIRESTRNRQTQEKLVEGLARIEGRLGIGVRLLKSGEGDGENRG
jgi:hypothetical protein